MKKTSASLWLIGLLIFGVAQVTASSCAFAEAAAAEPKKKEESKEDKPKTTDGVVGGRFAGDPIYVHIQPMVLPVINENGVEQLVTIIMDIQVKDFDSADELHSNMPRVMDALMRGLYGGLGDGVLRNGKLADVSKIKTKAIAAVGEVIPVAKIQDVLIQSISQRLL